MPGEASESDDEENTVSSSAPPNVVPILPKSAVAQVNKRHPSVKFRILSSNSNLDFRTPIIT